MSHVLRVALLAIVLPGAPLLAASVESKAGAIQAERIEAGYGKLPLAFEANRGQHGDSTDYLARGSGYTLSIGATNASFQLQNGVSTATVHMRVVGGNLKAQPEGLDKLEGTVNYLMGNDPQKWRQNIPTYGRVRYCDIYRGIDLVYYGNQRQLEYDFIVAPGEDASAIRLRFDGADNVAVDTNGDLLMSVGQTTLRQPKPVVYQEVNGEHRAVEGRYVVNENCEVSFDIGEYDATSPLTIDPTLVYSTYLGGTSTDLARAIAVDSAGNAYVTGYTRSNDFPTANAFQATFNTFQDVFVTKINAAGTAFIYSTYLGGSGSEEARGIAVDSSGNAYITGFTSSNNFPTVNAIQSTLDVGGQDAFVTKINAAGSALVYSTYLGGVGQFNSADFGEAIAVDTSGNAYVTGSTFSDSFPTVNAIQGTFGGGSTDAFVTKINAAGSAFVYSTYLGGNGAAAVSGVGGETGRAIAVDPAGNAYVAGEMDSTNFPTANAIQGTFAGGGTDAFVAKINPAGSALIYSTYLGGSKQDSAEGIKSDGFGNAYVAGFTQSTDFPTANALQPANGGTTTTQDAFVTKINAAGSALVYSTYLGGSGGEIAYGIAVDASGSAYVGGSTSSLDTFPTVNAIQCARLGSVDLFISKISPGGSGLMYSTYLGGSGSDNGQGIALDFANNAYITGYTDSTNFPTANPIQSSNSGGTPFGDALVAKLSDAVAQNSCATPACQSTINYTVGSTSVVLGGDTFDIAGTSNGSITLSPAVAVTGRFIGSITISPGGATTPPGQYMATITQTVTFDGGASTTVSRRIIYTVTASTRRVSLDSGETKTLEIGGGSRVEVSLNNLFEFGGYQNNTSALLTIPARGDDATYLLRAAGQLLNISTRMDVGTDPNQLIGGFIITGSQSKKVIVLATGPSLAAFGITGVLDDPVLELFQGNTLLASNDNWKVPNEAEIAATGLQPTHDLESALVQTLAPGSYSAIVRGTSGGTGVGTVQVFDLSPDSKSRLANISSRGFVRETDDKVMIAGFFVGGNGGSDSRVVVRALGPSLSAFGIPDVLDDPTLELKNANGGTLVSNDDWQQAAGAAEISSRGLAPSNTLESALVTSLPNGGYTAIVRAKAGGAGVGVVEVYNAECP